MKKTIAILMAASMMASLTACGSSSSAPATTAAAETKAEEAKTEETKAEEAQAEAAGSGIELKIGVSTAETDPRNIAAQKFADEIAEKTGGAVTAKVYPSGQLGGDAGGLSGGWSVWSGSGAV